MFSIVTLRDGIREARRRVEEEEEEEIRKVGKTWKEVEATAQNRIR
jgi:hypothetical protein